MRQLDYYVEIYEDLQKFYKQKKQALVKHNLDKLFLKIDETEKLLETKKDEIDAYLKKHEKEFASKVFKNWHIKVNTKYRFTTDLDESRFKKEQKKLWKQLQKTDLKTLREKEYKKIWEEYKIKRKERSGINLEIIPVKEDENE